MTRRPALLTQAEIRRAVRAAIQGGAGCVEVRPDGSILVHLAPPTAAENVEPALDEDRVIPL